MHIGGIIVCHFLIETFICSDDTQDTRVFLSLVIYQLDVSEPAIVHRITISRYYNGGKSTAAVDGGASSNSLMTSVT